MTDQLMTVAEVAEYLAVPVETVYRWRRYREGPVGFKVGRHVRYRREAVDAWLEERADERTAAAS